MRGINLMDNLGFPGFDSFSFGLFFSLLFLLGTFHDPFLVFVATVKRIVLLENGAHHSVHLVHFVMRTELSAALVWLFA